jgi:hypothetical protein
MNADRATHRSSRIELYADWLQHDADGLAFNLAAPADTPEDIGATAILATARDKLRGALELIENAIKADHAANAEKEAAL